MMNIDVERRGNVVIFNLEGRFVTENLLMLEDLWSGEVARGPEIIALNCKKLNGIDSPAIGTLVKFLNHAMSSNISLVFCDVNTGIRRLFRTARLHTFFKITTGAEFQRRYILHRSLN